MRLFKENKTFEQALPEFLETRKISISMDTYRGTVGMFNLFHKWLISYNYHNLSVRKLNSVIIAKFFNYLAIDRDLDKDTCGSYLTEIRLIFKYCLKRGWVEQLPFDLVVLPVKKVDAGAKVILAEDLERLLLTIKESDPQLYLACLFQYYCFLRPGRELRLLKIGDIDFEAGIIRVPMLKDKVRVGEIITIPIQLLKLCEEYELDKADKSFYVFGKKGVPGLVPWSINMMSFHFREIRKKLGLSDTYKFYSMKHTGATRFHESGAPIRSLMDQLRHKRLSATQHYVQKHSGLTNDRVKYNFPDPYPKDNISKVLTIKRRRTKHNTII